MKENDLFEIIGDIDDAKIEEAYRAKPKKRKTIFLKRLSFAACFVLIAVVSFSVANENDIKKEPVAKEQEKDGAETGTDNDFEILIDTEINNDDNVLPDTEKEETITDSNVLPDTEKEEANTDAVKPESSVVEDSFVNEETAREETSDRTSGGGGGSSGSSALKKDSYSLDYLNSLHEKIKELALSEEFSFIVSSFVNEDTNRVEVVVTSMEKDMIDRIVDLDTQGGAIDFKLSIVIQ
ncbi:MAG: hypothetical protein E7406_08710 [Ruminococcaceae bacterium]|nr:hypothetical protein [Oscillospiraceae bacterium]